MAGDRFRIRISRSGLDFEAEGDRKFIQEMIAKFLGENTPAPREKAVGGRAEPTHHELPDVSSKKQSVGEFVRTTAFKRHVDVVLAFGYYLEKMAGLTSFTAADINTCYYEAKLESSNSSQMLINNIKRGLAMEAKDQGKKGKRSYTLTRSGEQKVEEVIRDNNA